MSTKTQTTSDTSNKLNFDPGSKSIYDMLTKSGSGVLNDYISNPFGNDTYKLGLGQSQKGAASQGNNLMQSMLQNMKVSGLSGKSGNAFQLAQMGKIGRGTASMSSQANIQNIMQALQRQLTATGMGMSFNPLLTGEKGHSDETQQTSGLGTWLPQLLGAGLSGAMGAMTGGMSTGLSGIMKGVSGLPASSSASPGSSVFSGFGQIGMPNALPPPGTWT